MYKSAIRFSSLFLISAGMIACSSHTQRSFFMTSTDDVAPPVSNRIETPMPDGTMVAVNTQVPGAGGDVGGGVVRSMDNNDKIKMYRALDKAPGKSTQWTNMRTVITYTVLPVKKITLNGNPYCRTYTVTMTKNNLSQQMNGTACVAADGNWQAISGT